MTKIYELRHAVDQSTNYSVCVCVPTSPWFYTCWSLGRKLENTPNVPVEFAIEGKRPLEDFQMTNADHILVSQNLLGIIQASKAEFDAYDSIITKKGKIVDISYKVINFTSSFWCMDKAKSIYQDNPDIPGMVRKVEKIVISGSKLPQQDIFRLGESPSILLVNSIVKSAIESKKLAGLKFVEVEIS